MSETAWKAVDHIVHRCELKDKMSPAELDNLRGMIASALDDAWKQGFEDARLEARLESLMKIR